MTGSTGILRRKKYLFAPVFLGSKIGNVAFGGGAGAGGYVDLPASYLDSKETMDRIN